MTAVRFFGPIGENSGYGQAVRNFTHAFSESGIPTQFKFSHSNSKYLKEIKNHEGSTNIDFYLHCPPFNKHKSNNYKIGYFYWEADRLPNFWAKSIDILNEIWAPCDLVKTACERAGYKGRIKIVPTPVKEFDLNSGIGIPAIFSNEYLLSEDVFKFYSIFQWHERKGYKELLKAYLGEFSADDNVVLILKVNPLAIGGQDENKIVADILKVKNFIGKKPYPPIFLSRKIIKREDISALHVVSDCYVSPHHGEGWGMPIHDAMYAGKQIITTKFGGVTEYLDDTSAHIINHKLKPVSGMEWSPLYGPYQLWAYPNTNHLAGLMRDVYLNKDKYTFKSEAAKNIASQMSISSIAKIINREFINR